MRDLYSESCKVRDIVDNRITQYQTIKAISEKWGMFHVENKKLTFQEVKKDFFYYTIETNSVCPYPFIRGAKRINSLDSYESSNQDYEFYGIWHTHPDFRDNSPTSCDARFGFGYPSGSANLPSANCGEKHGDVQATILPNVGGGITVSYWPHTWRTLGGIGIIPSSKGITIYRHSGPFYKEFIHCPPKCNEPISYQNRCYCQWDYNYFNGIEQNSIDNTKQEKIDKGGFHVISYNFSYKISAEK